MIMSFNQYMDTVKAKVNAAKGDLIGNGLRNEFGFAETAKRLCTSAENLYFSLGEGIFEPVNSMFTAFSVRPGLNDVSNVAAVDIIDIGIQSTRQSVMGYLCAERAMSNPIDLAWYQTLVATNDAGGLNKGDTAFTPFSPISTKLNLGATTTPLNETKVTLTADTKEFNDIKEAFKDQTITTASTVYKFAKAPVVTKQVTLTIKSTDEGNPIVGVGSDLKGDGVIYFSENNGACTSAVVNYEKGLILINGLNYENGVSGMANVERTAERTGSSTLKLKPKTISIQLEAKPNRIILENSFEENAFINKQAFSAANIGLQMDFGRRAINQLLQSFTWYLDLTAIYSTWNALNNCFKKNTVTAEILDLTDYLLSSSQAATKNDFVNQAMLRLNKELQKRTGKGATCYLVDTEAAIVLGNCETYFTGNPSFDTNLDGMIGTYRGVPVVRHHALDDMLNSDTTITLPGLEGVTRVAGDLYGVVIAVYKSPDGQAAPSMYAEYLPPYSVLPALNYDNPSQFSQSLLSMSTTEELVPDLTHAIYIKVSSGN